jgi:hypothetical protein
MQRYVTEETSCSINLKKYFTFAILSQFIAIPFSYPAYFKICEYNNTLPFLVSQALVLY